MKATSTELQKEYVRLLNGNVSGAVYDQVPENPSYPYVQIGNQTGVDYSDKTSQGEEKTQTLWIVDRYSGSFGDRGNVYTLENEILGIICDRPIEFDLDGFNMIQSVLDLSNFSIERTETHTYFRIEMRFRHEIEEL